MKKPFKWGLILLVAGLLVGWLLWQSLTKSEGVEAIKLAAKPVIATMTVTGEVHADATVSFSSPVMARIATVFVDEGDTIHAGQQLAQLDVSEANALLEQAQEQAMQAKAAEQEAFQGTRIEKLRLLKARQAEASQRIEQSQLALRQAELRAEDAQRNARRFFQLRQQDLISIQDLETAQLQASVSDREVSRLQAELLASRQGLQQVMAQLQEAQNGQTPAQLAQSAAAARASGAFAKAQRYKIQDYQIVSTLNGTITERLQEPGDLAQPGKAILTAIDPKTLEILCDVEENDLQQLAIGNLAYVVLDALPEVLLPGQVIRIGNQVNPENGTVSVRVQLKSSALKQLKTFKLLSGMTADVNIVTARLKRALVLPTTAIFRDKNKNFVFVFEGHQLQSQAVTIVRLSTESVQITSGVHAGQWVAKVATPSLLEKKRVHPIETLLKE
jgi:HlyD family secretion protein